MKKFLEQCGNIAFFQKFFNKPLFIVLVGYQEFEAINKFKMFEDSLPIERQIFIDMMKTNNIYFIKASDLLNQEIIHIPSIH